LFLFFFLQVPNIVLPKPISVHRSIIDDQLKENIPEKPASDQFFQVASIYHHPLTDLGFYANDYSPKKDTQIVRKWFKDIATITTKMNCIFKKSTFT